jgi:hypothetical protein
MCHLYRMLRLYVTTEEYVVLSVHICRDIHSSRKSSSSHRLAIMGLHSLQDRAVARYFCYIHALYHYFHRHRRRTQQYWCSLGPFALLS